MSDSDGKKTLGLRGGSHSGNVKQSFSHGRTKNVVVETKRKRVVVPKPGAGKAAGGSSPKAGDPSRLRGTAFAYESRLPDGSVLPVGTVGMAVTAEQLAMWSYLRVRDPRDPDFQGGLTVAGSVQSGGDADVGGQLVLGAMRKDGEFCHPENAVAGEADGGLLVCRENRWRSPSRSGSGGYGYHSMHGCQTQEGASTANPVTGDCSCPWYSVAVRIMETGNIFPDGMQYAYLCVG